MDKNWLNRGHHSNNNIAFALPSTPDGRRSAYRPSASGAQYSSLTPATYNVQPRIILSTPDRPYNSRMVSDHEMHDYADDDVLSSDEEAGLGSADRRKRAQQKKRNTRLDQRVAQDLPGGSEEKKLANQHLYKDLAINAILILAWYSFSIGISVFNKYVLSPDKLGFSFPLFFTSFHMIVQFMLAGMVMYCFPHLQPRAAADTQYQQVSQENGDAVAEPQEKRPIMAKMFYLTRIGPCGAATGLDIGLGNMSLKYIKLTFYTMCKSSVLGFVLLFAFLFRLEKPSWRLAGVILTMSAGVVMMVAGEAAFNALGFILIMAASFFSGFRWSLTQILLIRNPATSNPFSSIFFLAPVMFVTLIIIALPVEGPVRFGQGLHALVETTGLFKAIGVLLFPGILAFLMTASEFALLQRTSVVTLSVCGIFKEVLTITTAALTFGDELTAINISGLTVTICSIAAYNYMKFTNMKAEAKKEAHAEIERRASLQLPSEGRPSTQSRSGEDDLRTSTSSLIRNSLVISSDAERPHRTLSPGPSPAKRPEDLE